MTLEISADVDIVYLYLKEAEIVNTRMVQPGVMFDYSADGEVVGIEVTNATARFGDLEGLKAEEMLAKTLGDFNFPTLETAAAA